MTVCRRAQSSCSSSASAPSAKSRCRTSWASPSPTPWPSSEDAELAAGAVSGGPLALRRGGHGPRRNFQSAPRVRARSSGARGVGDRFRCPAARRRRRPEEFRILVRMKTPPRPLVLAVLLVGGGPLHGCGPRSGARPAVRPVTPKYGWLRDASSRRWGKPDLALLRRFRVPHVLAGEDGPADLVRWSDGSARRTTTYAIDPRPSARRRWTDLRPMDFRTPSTPTPRDGRTRPLPSRSTSRAGRPRTTSTSPSSTRRGRGNAPDENDSLGCGIPRARWRR